MTFAADAADIPTEATRTVTAYDAAVDAVMADRALASRLLREHQMLHALFEHGPVACAVRGEDGALLAWNALHETLHGEGDAPLPRLDVPSHEHDAGEDGVYRVHDYALPGGAVARLAVPLAAEKAREAELIRAREAAEAGVQARTDMLANMSHEIRTPLNGLLGMASLLAESGLSKGQQMYADVVVRSGEALLAITNDILDLSKIEAGRMELDHASFDIAECIEETATLFAACADEKGVDMTVRIDPALPRRLIGDRSRLRQVLANLLGNAVKFTDAGRIAVVVDARIGTREDGRRTARLACRVSDTGAGIPAEKCATVFDRFTQADGDAKRAGQGTGLGLAVVEALIGEMGGTVGVESVEGEGTTFRFDIELPLDAAETMRRAGEGAQGKRVMIVDGDDAHRDTVADCVRAWGFQVAPCTSAREATALLDAIEARGQTIDVVLLGERIAEGPVTLLTETLRSRTGLRPPVILMARLSALSMCDADEEAGLPLVATLPRPVRSAPLLESMEAAVARAPYAPMLPAVIADAPPEGTPSDPQDAAPVSASDEAATLPESEPTTRIVEEEEVAAPEPESLVAEEGSGVPLALAEPMPPAAPTPAAPTTMLDILVAEDNRINQMLIEEILRDTGYTYRIVADGTEAVAAWRSDRPRLVLMDVSMPSMSGDEATKRIRAEEEGRSRTPIIAVTAHALRGDRERCLRAGMDDHLTKPVTVAAVMKAIETYLHPEAMRAAG